MGFHFRNASTIASNAGFLPYVVLNMRGAYCLPFLLSQELLSVNPQVSMLLHSGCLRHSLTICAYTRPCAWSSAGVQRAEHRMSNSVKCTSRPSAAKRAMFAPMVVRSVPIEMWNCSPTPSIGIERLSMPRTMPYMFVLFSQIECTL